MRNFPPGGYNYSRYCNPDMQAAQNVALTHYDRPTRQAAYYRIQELLARDNPELFDWWITRRWSRSASISKASIPIPSSKSWNAWQWSI